MPCTSTTSSPSSSPRASVGPESQKLTRSPCTVAVRRAVRLIARISHAAEHGAAPLRPTAPYGEVRAPVVVTLGGLRSADGAREWCAGAHSRPHVAQQRVRVTTILSIQTSAVAQVHGGRRAMDGLLLGVVIAAVVVVLVGVVLLVVARHRARATTASLRSRFGAEYDRVTAAYGRRNGEQELRARVRRRKE